MSDERGAVSVVVALLMVPLIGFAAVAIDVAAMYAERSQLQSGADAGALAIAQDCGRGTCGATSRTAQTYAHLNLTNASSTATVTALSGSQVTVRNSGTKQHLFAPVLGINSTVIGTSATAAWGSPTGGTAILPLAISWCEWQAQTGGGLPNGTTARVISLPTEAAKPTEPTEPAQPTELSEPAQPTEPTVPIEPTDKCTGPSGQAVPGGFGWLPTAPGTCETTSRIGVQLRPSLGTTPPGGCSPADFKAQQGKTVILPLFDASSENQYQVYGYAAFTITGYYFAGQDKWSSPCSGSESCIKGYFARLVDLSDLFTYGPSAPPLGAAIVQLTQ